MSTGGSGGFQSGMVHVLSVVGPSGRMGEPDLVRYVHGNARMDRRDPRARVGFVNQSPSVGAAFGGSATDWMWGAVGVTLPGFKVLLRRVMLSPGTRPLPPALEWAPESAASLREAVTT